MNTKLPKRTPEQYREDRAALDKVLQAECASFDKAVMQIACGAIAVSLAFLDKIANPPVLKAWLLGLSWVALVFSLIVSVVGFLFSHAKLKREIYALDAEQKNNTDDPEKRDSNPQPISRRKQLWAWLVSKLTIKRLNIAAAISLVGGLLLMLLFAYVNLDTRRCDMNKQRNGSSTPPPAKQKNLSNEAPPTAANEQPCRGRQPRTNESISRVPIEKAYDGTGAPVPTGPPPSDKKK